MRVKLLAERILAKIFEKINIKYPIKYIFLFINKQYFRFYQYYIED